MLPASGFSGGFCDSHPGFCGCDFPGDFCFRFFYGSEKFPVAAGRFEGFDLPVQVRNGGLFGAEEITGPQHVVDGRDKVFVAVAAARLPENAARSPQFRLDPSRPAPRTFYPQRVLRSTLSVRTSRLAAPGPLIRTADAGCSGMGCWAASEARTKRWSVGNDATWVLSADSGSRTEKIFREKWPESFAATSE